MTDFLYSTARKPIKQHRTLSFNPQSSLKPTQQTNTHNKLQTKRKTPSKRYINVNEAQINKTIDFASFKTHQRTLSVGKQNQFIELPQIQIPKNKRGAKKGSYLQIWLNQALDQGQGNQNFLTSINDQTLGALKKYGIDRKLLKTKNISQQTINKIYNKLYVYSKGLGMTFQQIGKLASMKSPFQQNSVQSSDSQIIQIFWKAFSKIMQNQTPYESAFQVIQKNYIKTIQQLKMKMRGVGQQISQMQKQHNEQKRKLQRQLQMLTVRYKQLQNQFRVNKSTLQLTDKSLDDEVQLRLKFQQKINSVYTSYNEMKSKYASLVQQLGMKRQQRIQNQQSQGDMKIRLQQMQTKCRQMQHMLMLQQHKVRDLHSQLLIKKQQKSELQMQLLGNQQLVKRQQDEIAQYIRKIKLVNGLLVESGNEMVRLKQILQQEKLVGSKLSRRVEELSQINNLLYIDKYKVYQESAQLKQKNQLLTKQNMIKQQHVGKLTQQNSKKKQQILSLLDELSHSKALIQDITYQLQIKTSLLTNANQNISKLKQIKDRHQRLHLLAQHQRDQAINQNITIMSKLHQQQLQVQNLRNQILQKQQSAAIELTRSNKNKQLLTKKILALQEQLTKKDQSQMSSLNSLQIERIQLLKKQREINQVKQKMQTREHLIYKLQSQSVLLAANQPLIQQLLHKKQLQLTKLNEKNLQNIVTENQLNNKVQQIMMLLNIKSNQIQIQTQCFKKLAQSYKQMYDQRKQFVHPMVYQDLLMYTKGLEQKIVEANKIMEDINKENQETRLEHQKLTNQIHKHIAEIIKLHQSINLFKQTVCNLEKQNDDLRDNLKEEINKSLLMIQHQNKLNAEIQQFKHQKTIMEKQVEKIKTQNNLLGEKIVKKDLKIKEINMVKDELASKNQQLTQQLIEFQQKCTQLQQKLTKYYTIKSNATTQTDPINIKAQSPSPLNHHFRKSQRNLGTPSQTLKIPPTTPSKIQNFQSKQITQSLIQHSFQHTSQIKGQQKNHQLNKFMIQTQTLLKQPQIVQKQKVPTSDKKKVEKGEFKRALKLTFMRR